MRDSKKTGQTVSAGASTGAGEGAVRRRRGRPAKPLPLEFQSSHVINGSAPISDNRRLLSKQQLADYLQVSLATLQRRVIGKGAPWVPVGGQLRFDLTEVLAWLRSQGA